MSETEDNILTIKEVKKNNKKGTKMNLSEAERNRRSENFKKALSQRKKNIEEKKSMNNYKDTLKNLLLSSSEEDEDEEENIKNIQEESEEEEQPKKTQKKKKNNNSSINENINVNQNNDLINQLRNEFNEHLKCLLSNQEKVNNRVEKLYTMKKSKMGYGKKEPIIIQNEKQQPKIKESLQDAMLSKILNNN